jgi:hypothetical protein
MLLDLMDVPQQLTAQHSTQVNLRMQMLLLLVPQ